MKLIKQEDIAVLLMSELTKNYHRRLVPLSEISKRHGVSGPFLKKIARLLRKANLVESKEGVGGGYALVDDPQKVSVWEVVKAASSQTFVPVRLWREACPINTKCLPQHINKTIQESIEFGLKRITLQSLTQ